ncbi:hypothetical protein G0Q06_03835 [Puniceicoccales bacterium CK1056]|uniref:LTD domain-containing protein n=1 Tax=Oceanipulchritudo coccoides TaxID=2706888 RepID=A0A6B2LZJ3_9BACT|nr:glycoside hydrolase family 99-like domain-containing protein [Oceanipulchritudo coccoides]NDV61572.1 hypothetical protein [Oceanipulchritudo coccoides]
MNTKNIEKTGSTDRIYSWATIIFALFLVWGNTPAIAEKTGVLCSNNATPASLHELQIGAYYYPWYGSDGRHWNEGYFRGDLRPQQLPLLGEYDSRDEATINQHIEWAKDAGIDFFALSFWGEDTWVNQTAKNCFTKASALKDFKFTILYETVADKLLVPYRVKGDLTFELGNELEQRFIDSIDYLAETYFSHPSYLRIDDKPVLIIYVTHQFAGDYKGAIQRLRATIREKHGMELFLIGDEVDPIKPPVEDRIACFDAITPYIQYASPIQTLPDTALGYADDVWILQNARMKNTRFKAISDRLGIEFVPNALPGFNDRGVRLDVNHYYLPHRRNAHDPRKYGLFEDYLDMAGEFMNPDFKLMMVTSWNEWHEDTQLEPDSGVPTREPATHTVGLNVEPYGFDLLNILKEFKNTYSGPKSLPSVKKINITELCLAVNGNKQAGYIELHNPGSESVDLQGMRLCLRSRHDSFERDNFYVKLSGSIPAGENYLVATPAARDFLKEKEQLTVDQTTTAAVLPRISMNNGQIALRDQEGRIVDAFSWTAESSFDGDYVEKDNFKIDTVPAPNQSIIRRSHKQDRNNNALDFTIDLSSPKR